MQLHRQRVAWCLAAAAVLAACSARPDGSAADTDEGRNGRPGEVDDPGRDVPEADSEEHGDTDASDALSDAAEDTASNADGDGDGGAGDATDDPLADAAADGDAETAGDPDTRDVFDAEVVDPRDAADGPMDVADPGDTGDGPMDVADPDAGDVREDAAADIDVPDDADDAADADGDAAVCPDSDRDTVCDDADLCPGGDDRLDRDGDGIPDACEPTVGSYQYARLEVARLGEAFAVEFAPDGAIAIVLERRSVVRVFSAEDSTWSRTELGSSVYLSDVGFSPDGSTAVIVGYDLSSGSRGVVYAFDRSAWDVSGDLSGALRALSGVTARPAFEAVSFGPDSTQPVLLSRSAAYPYTMWLDRLDPAGGTSALQFARATSAGCQDVAYVLNEFGRPGYLIVCGINGYDGLYWTLVGGEWEVRESLGFDRLGNSSRIIARPDGAYALVVQNSSSRLYRFERGLMNDASAAPGWSTRRMWGGAFDPRGWRALILGRSQTISSVTFGGVFEYRHDEYRCPAPLSDCAITEVSIPNFGAPPWNAPSDTSIWDAAWRPGCDGGLIVGGKSDWSGDWGFVGTFQLEGGVRCW